MSELDHWHPVMRSQDLRPGPAVVKLCGREIAIFRTPSGQVGAIEDRCCHRGMRLSRGHVDNDGCLVCPYHGWRYSLDGRLETSSTPKLTHNTEYFRTCEKWGLIWLTSGHSEAGFPQIDFDGFRYVDTIIQEVDAPLELALDNFTEVEHTGTAHVYFGYAPNETAHIETRLSLTSETTAVVNKGVQRGFPFFLRPIVEARAGDWFFNTWVTYFSPVYTVYDQYWLSPDETIRRPLGLKIAIFFNPLDENRTQMISLVYGRSKWQSTITWGIARQILGRMTRYELGLDKTIINGLADKSVSLRGKKLGRFDQPLVQNRKRILNIYRGIETAPDLIESLPPGQFASSSH